MTRLLRVVAGKNIGSFESLGSTGSLILFICLVVMSISIITMLLFSCADGFEQDKHRKAAARIRRASLYSATGGDPAGAGVYGGHGGAGGGYFGGGDGGGGGC